MTDNQSDTRNQRRIANGLEPRGIYLDQDAYARADDAARTAHDDNPWNWPQRWPVRLEVSADWGPLLERVGAWAVYALVFALAAALAAALILGVAWVTS